MSRANWDVFALLAEAMGFTEPFFRQQADQLIDRLLEVPRGMREGIDRAALEQGRAVELRIPPGPPAYATTSGKIELLNPDQPSPLPVFLPPHGGDLPLNLLTAPSLYALNSSFYEQDELRRRQQAMYLKMSAADADVRGLSDGTPVIVANQLGEVCFILQVSDQVPAGVVVAEGVWWLEFAPGRRSVNALTSQRLTDQGGGSTFYDNRVDVRRA
jgi:anaerobic selenocysteine-containing dehydrogenase